MQITLVASPRNQYKTPEARQLRAFCCPTPNERAPLLGHQLDQAADAPFETIELAAPILGGDVPARAQPVTSRWTP